MSEWLKEHAWKACVGETLPWVRIPLSPPVLTHPTHFSRNSARFRRHIDGGEKPCGAVSDIAEKLCETLLLETGLPSCVTQTRHWPAAKVVRARTNPTSHTRGRMLALRRRHMCGGSLCAAVYETGSFPNRSGAFWRHSWSIRWTNVTAIEPSPTGDTRGTASSPIVRRITISCVGSTSADTKSPNQRT
jgi:hypothetical protein